MEKKNCERVVNNVTEEVKYANIFGQHCFSWTICHPFHNGTPVTKALLNVGVKTSMTYMFQQITRTRAYHNKNQKPVILKYSRISVTGRTICKVHFNCFLYQKKTFFYSLHILILLLSFSVWNLWTRFPFHLCLLSRVAIGGFIFRYFIFTF